jgi:hypothetical protein
MQSAGRSSRLTAENTDKPLKLSTLERLSGALMIGVLKDWGL